MDSEVAITAFCIGLSPAGEVQSSQGFSRSLPNRNVEGFPDFEVKKNGGTFITEDLLWKNRDCL